METNLPGFITDPILGSLQNSEISDPVRECFDDSKILNDDLASNRSVESLDVVKSPMKSPKVLSFDPYGNLTTSDDPSQDFNSLVDFNYVLEGFENSFRSEAESDISVNNASSIKNGSLHKKSRSAKTNPKSPKTPILSDEALEKAFKPSVNVVPTTRSGRHCKQKSEAGFLFGTFNFNEIKKLTSNSPKRTKPALTAEIDTIKNGTSSSQSPTSSPKLHLTTDPEYSSSEEFQSPQNIKSKKRTKKSKTSSSLLNHDSSISEGEPENSKPPPRKRGRPRKRVELDEQPLKVKDEVDSLSNHNSSKKVKNKEARKARSTSNDCESKCVSDEPQDMNIKNSLRNAKKIKEEKFIGSLEDDVHIIKNSLMNSFSMSSESFVTEDDLKNCSSLDKLDNDIEMKAVDKLQSKADDTPQENHSDIDTLDLTTTKSGRQIRKPAFIDLSNEDRKINEATLETKRSDFLVVEEDHLSPGNCNEKGLDKEYPCEYFVGDLLWIIIKGSPLWPAMVSYPKDEEYYAKIVNCGPTKLRKYHVNFFCDNERTGWFKNSCIITFNGKESLNAYLEESKSSAAKSKKSAYGHSILQTLSLQKRTQGYKLERWLDAIKEAESYFPLDRYQRVQKAKQNSSEDEKVERRRISQQNKVRKRKLKSEKQTPKLAENNNDEFLGFEDSSSAEERNAKRRKLHMKLLGSFDIYLQKHLDSCLKDNAYFTQENAKKHLRRKWRKLTPVQKARYRSHRSDDSKAPLYTIDSDESSSESSSTSVSACGRKNTSGTSRSTCRVPRSEKVCFICGFSSSKNIVKCKGVCNGNFHLECVGLSVQPTSDFKCASCLSGIHSCFVCKNNEGKIIKCSIPSCGKFYHDSCIRKWPQVSKSRQFEKLVCPRHICHMCAANADDMNDPAARTPPFTRCIHCPTTYHTGDTCIAAGIEEISLNYHICTKHIVPKNNFHYNVNWCFCCSKGGSLLLCDQCPAAFHAECMNISAPEGDYICEDCENGKYPVYGDIVWVKVGAHRWWPAQVLHPKYIPANIDHLNHQQGMFCVHFFGSNDYFWVPRGRAFLYQEGDQGSKGGRSKLIEQQFQKALDEVIVAYHKQKKIRDEQEASRSLKGNKKPPTYVRIDTNRPVGNVRLGKLDLSSVNKCECNPFLENPCSSDDKCLNRMLMIECIREACPAGNRCQNQRFQKRLYPNVTHFKTSARGWGLKTKDFIKKGNFVIEYVGELIDDTELKRRIEEMHEVKEENYYFLTIDKDRIIDAGPKGNLSRFMNHSCDPNCDTQKWTVGADTRVGLFALHDIPEGSELTFNYNLECIGTGKKKCNCDTKKCSGFIGAKIQKPESSSGKKSENGGLGRSKNEKKKKRKRRVKSKKNSESECFRCNSSGGDLVLCDATMCPKGYHLKCLDLDSPPRGKWLCPWHYCDECGCKASNRCILCPNSYCRFHSPGKFHPTVGFGNVCLEHKAEEFQALRGQMVDVQAPPPPERLPESRAENTAQKCQPEEKAPGSNDQQQQQSSLLTKTHIIPTSGLPIECSPKSLPVQQPLLAEAGHFSTEQCNMPPQVENDRRKSSRLNCILSPIVDNAFTGPSLISSSNKSSGKSSTPNAKKTFTRNKRRAIGANMKENVTVVNNGQHYKKV